MSQTIISYTLGIFLVRAKCHTFCAIVENVTKVKSQIHSTQSMKTSVLLIKQSMMVLFRSYNLAQFLKLFQTCFLFFPYTGNVSPVAFGQSFLLSTFLQTDFVDKTETDDRRTRHLKFSARKHRQTR